MNEALDQGTMDEPVLDTVRRDIRLIIGKFKIVLFFHKHYDNFENISKNWDLWGPFILCLSLSIILATQAGNDTGSVFSLMYILFWFGSGIVTINLILLKGNVSFFQTVCVLGYCVFPLLLSSIICFVINQLLSHGTLVHGSLRLASVILGAVWGSRASVNFMSGLVAPEKRLLAVYPVCLFYLAVGWIILLT